MPDVIRVRAAAKINLTLRVLAVHADGYHELRTTFQSLALHDTLTFTRARGPFVITSDSPECPADESNLVWKAASRVWQASGRAGALRGMRVHIAKRIPVQAGLGGGSSDAAAALRVLRRVWAPRLPEDAVDDIARSLGADVAFFLEGGTMLGVERGDLLFPLEDAAPAWVVLARPGFGVSTREAYGWWDEANHARVAAGAGQPRGGREAEWVNDLEAPVVARHPEIGRLVQRLGRLGARFAAMSGSGSAVFGLFDARDAAERACAALATGATRTWLTRTTNRRTYRRLSGFGH